MEIAPPYDQNNSRVVHCWAKNFPIVIWALKNLKSVGKFFLNI